MTDIKITLSRNEKLYCADIDKEIEWLRDQGSLWYSIGIKKPRNVNEGEWIYFVLKDELVGRAKINQIEEPENGFLPSCRGKMLDKNRWGIRITAIDKSKTRIEHESFPGFRYVKDDEKQEFERAFR